MSVLGFGTVASFDDHRGLGVVVDRDGREWPFHCTAIAGGTRTIEVGVPVAFVKVAGNLGEMWADELTQLPPTLPPSPSEARPPSGEPGSPPSA